MIGGWRRRSRYKGEKKRGSAERVDGAKVGTNERQGAKDRLSDHNWYQNNSFGRFSEVEFILKWRSDQGKGPKVFLVELPVWTIAGWSAGEKYSNTTVQWFKFFYTVHTCTYILDIQNCSISEGWEKKAILHVQSTKERKRIPGRGKQGYLKIASTIDARSNI